jgi:hypothetical protein
MAPRQINYLLMAQSVYVAAGVWTNNQKHAAQNNDLLVPASFDCLTHMDHCLN